MPLVSVIIPTYNRQKLVQEAITSVLRQTYADYEVIVVDDGSTDDTGLVLEQRYGATIRYFYQDNQGESAARNLGIGRAKGEYIAFLDSDDLWHPKKLEHQVDAFEVSKDAGMISTQAYWINYEGLKLRLLPHGHDLPGSTVSWEDLVLDNVVAGGGSTAMVRRSCLERVGGFDVDIQFGEEWDLWLRLARHFRIHQIPEPLSYYRLHRHGTRGWAPRRHEAEAMFADHRTILRKAFADCPHERRHCDVLRRQAFGRISLRQALVDCALGNARSGREYWEHALQLDPDRTTNVSSVSRLIVHFVTGYASLAPERTQIGQIDRLLDQILDNLPTRVRAVGAKRVSIRAGCLAEMAFLAATYKRTGLARHAAWQCLIADRGWSRNLGLLKVLVTGGRHLWPQQLSV
jgi:GT2 family glycosyltransferase